MGKWNFLSVQVALTFVEYLFFIINRNDTETQQKIWKLLKYTSEIGTIFRRKATIIQKINIKCVSLIAFSGFLYWLNWTSSASSESMLRAAEKKLLSCEFKQNFYGCRLFELCDWFKTLKFIWSECIEKKRRLIEFGMHLFGL